MTISVVGNLPLQAAQEKLEPLLAHLPKTPVKLDLPKPVPALQESLVVTQSKDDLSLAEIVRGWVGTGVDDADRPALSVVSGLFSVGLSSRLVDTFREGRRKGAGKPGLCYTVRTSLASQKNSGMFQFYIGTNPKNITLVQDLFQQELNDMLTTLASDEELAKTKAQIKRALLSNLQAPNVISTEIATHRGLDHDSTLDLLSKIDAVTAEEVKAVAVKYLGQASVTSIFAPSEALTSQGLPANGEVLTTNS